MKTNHSHYNIHLFITLVILLLTAPSLCKSKCLSGDCNNGSGVKSLAGVKKFKGHFINGQPAGQGILSWQTGISAEGYFKGWDISKGICHIKCSDNITHFYAFTKTESVGSVARLVCNKKTERKHLSLSKCYLTTLEFQIVSDRETLHCDSLEIEKHSAVCRDQNTFVEYPLETITALSALIDGETSHAQSHSSFVNFLEQTVAKVEKENNQKKEKERILLIQHHKEAKARALIEAQNASIRRQKRQQRRSAKKARKQQKQLERQRIRLICQDDCAINKHQFNQSCYSACMYRYGAF